MSLLSNKYRIAIYLRLSRDDGNEESQSIQSQREMLTAYVQRQGWQILDECLILYMMNIKYMVII